MHEEDAVEPPKPIDLQGRLAALGLDESRFATLLSSLGDTRDGATILRAVRRVCAGEEEASGELRAVLTLLDRARSRARRIADAADWRPAEGGALVAELDGVRLTLHPQSRGRWSIIARRLADGHSPDAPHWRSSLEEAKIRAALAVDEALERSALAAMDAAGGA